MQHTDHCVSRRSVADEVPHTHLLHGRPEGLDVGAMEGKAGRCTRLLSCSIALIPRFEAFWPGPVAFDHRNGRRCAIALTLAEREEISRAVAEGQSIRSIAARLGRAPSTVSREIRRNGGQADYRASEADSAAWDRALRPKRCKLAENRALAQHRDRQASAAVVARTNRRVAQAYLSARREPSRVTRDHLPQPLHPGAWRPEEGAAAAPEAHARHASVSASHAEDRHPRADRRRRVDQRTPCVRRGSRGAWSLGRRSAVRRSQQPDRHAGRAPNALRHARQGGGPRTRRRSSTR